MGDAHAPTDSPAAFAGGQALERLGLLMVGEFGLAAEPRALGLNGAAAVVARLKILLALIIGQRR